MSNTVRSLLYKTILVQFPWNGHEMTFVCLFWKTENFVCLLKLLAMPNVPILSIDIFTFANKIDSPSPLLWQCIWLNRTKCLKTWNKEKQTNLKRPPPSEGTYNYAQRKLNCTHYQERVLVKGKESWFFLRSYKGNSQIWGIRHQFWHFC